MNATTEPATVIIVPLTQGQFALVNADDWERLRPYSWHAAWDVRTRSFRAVTTRRDPDTKKMLTTRMERMILATPPGQESDHVNHNTLDNRRENLRTCTRSQNQANARQYRDSKAPYKGITFAHGHGRSHGKWMARICVEGRRLHLGYYDDPAEAARAYDRAALQHFGDFACINGV